MLRHPAKGFASEEIGGRVSTATVTWGANFKIEGKCDPQKLSYSGAWKSQQGTIKQLSAHISKGLPWMPALLDGNRKRWQVNANYAVLGSLDVDDRLTIKEALARPFIEKYCCLLIESASSTPERNKFRLVFRYAEPLTNWQDIRLCNEFLAEQIEGVADPACKDAGRYYFGSPNREPILINEQAVLPEDFLQQAKQWRQIQEAKAQAEAEAALERRKQYAPQSEAELLDLVEMALAAGAPVRSPGCGNYADCVALAAGLKNEFGDAIAVSLLEKYIPPHYGSRDGWNPAKVVTALKSNGSRPATLGTVFYICKQNGFRFPQREWQSGKGFGQSRQAGEIQEHNEDQTLLSSLLNLKPRKRARRARVEPIKSDFSVVEINSPDQQIQVYQDAQSKGWKYVLNISDTGVGKSYWAGLLTTDHFEGVNQILYFCGQPRNPSTVTVEANFTEMPVRNRGMVDTGLRTKLGNPVKRPATVSESKPNSGNCHLAHLHLAAASKGFAPGGEGTISDICRACSFNIPREGEDASECAAHSGPGFGFRHERKLGFQSKLIRMHLNSAPDKVDGLAIGEEIGQLLNPERRMATNDDLNREWALIEEAYPEYFEVLAPIRRSLRNASAKPDRWGTTPDKIKGKESITAEILLALKPILKPSLTTFLGGEKTTSLAEQAKKDLKSAERDFDKAVGLVERIKKLEQEVTQRSKKKLEKLSRLKAELKQIDSTLGDRFEAAYALEAQAKVASPRRKSTDDIETAIEKIGTQALWDILSVLFTGVGSFRIGDGRIDLILPDRRVADLSRSAKMNIYLDATTNPHILCAQLGINPSELLVVKVSQQKPDNLKHVQVSGFGLCKRDRAASTNQRLAALHEGIKQDTARRLGTNDFDLEVIDFKDVEGSAAKIQHNVNGRGSNLLEGCKVLVVHGLPKPNMGAIQDEYACLVDPPFSFEQYYQHRCDAEIIQEAGRNRSDRYPDQNFLIYWVTEDNLPFEAEQVDAADLCLDAAAPGERIWRQVEAIVEQGLTLSGECPTLEQLAEKLSCTAAWISQLAKRFAGGWLNFKRMALSLLNPPSPSEAPPTEAEAEAEARLPKLITKRGAAFVQALAAAIAGLDWLGWLRVVSRLSRDLQLEILSKLVEAFSRSGGELNAA